MRKKTKRSIQWVKERNSKKYAGVHLIAELWRGKVLGSSSQAERLLKMAAKESNSTPLKISVHKFAPYGLTGVILLAESHIAIHVWPEMNYTAIDIFTCGDKSSPEKALACFKRELEPKEVEVKIFKRGAVS